MTKAHAPDRSQTRARPHSAGRKSQRYMICLFADTARLARTQIAKACGTTRAAASVLHAWLVTEGAYIEFAK